MSLLAAATPTADEARREAEKILAERRFHSASLPDPITGVFSKIGDLLTPIGDQITRWVQDLADGVPGGGGVALVVGAGLVLIAAAYVATRALRRRGASAWSTWQAPAAARPGPTARELEREADEAERSGEFERAVRLRFRAGLMRLDEGGLVRVRASTPTREVARALRSGAFDRVAAGFDAVAYGGRQPGSEDAMVQRTGWRAVLDEVGAR